MRDVRVIIFGLSEYLSISAIKMAEDLQKYGN